MTVSLGHIRLRVHPLMLMFPLLALRLGRKEDAAALILGLSVHECGHLLAAKCARVGVSGVNLMPFGGAIALDNPYLLSQGRLIAVAAAGPLGNLFALVVCAALAHWRILSEAFALSALNANLALMLFNLLPALPLDGGRIACALLFPKLGRGRSVELGICSGRILAALLLALAVWTGFACGRLNLSPVVCAVFILASAPDERRALCDLRARTLLDGLSPMGESVPARLCAVSASAPLGAALRCAEPGMLTFYAIYEEYRFWGISDERRMLEAALARGPTAPVCEAGTLSFPQDKGPLLRPD